MAARIPSIRKRLFILMVAGVLPAAFIMFGLIAYNYQRERAQLEATTLATTRALAAALDQQLASIETGLTVLASSTLLEKPDLAGFHARALSVAQTLKVTSVGLIDPQGKQMLNTLQPLGKVLPPIGPKSQLREIFSTGKPVLANLFVGPTTGKPSLALGVPSLRDGQVAYCVAAGIAPSVLRELLQAQKLPPTWIVGILDGNGTIVARSHEHDRFVGVRPREDLVRRVTTSSAGAVAGITVAGEPVLTVYSRAPRSQWTVVIGIPADELTAELRQSIVLLMAATALLLAIGLLLAGVQARSITRSVSQLVDQARSLGKGEPAAHPRVSFREAAVLGDAFVDAAARLEAALLRSEGRMQAILDSATDAILAVDEGHRIVVFNGAATALFGYSQDDALGMPLDRVLPLAQRGRAGLWLEDMSSVNMPATVDVLQPANMPRPANEPDRMAHAVRRDGSEFPIEASVSSVIQDGATYFTVIFRDMTERQRIRQALLRSNQELKQFAFVASHDLRAPLRSIEGFLSLLATRHAGALDADAQALVQRATRAVHQLDSLTDDLLTYARVEAPERAHLPVDCNAVVGDTLALLSAGIAQGRAQVHVTPLPVVQGDRIQLQQLFQNLIGNAIKYRGERAPEVWVTAQRGATEWVFAVADNGIGIKAQHQRRIFEIFKRLHTHEEYDGNGIGLAVCQRVVQHHGGRIWVESEPGQGSTFFFSIPDDKGAP